jgi:hypothetical protein
MNRIELDLALRKLRLSGMAEVLEIRLLEAQKSEWAGIDLLSALVQDELQRRQDRLLARRIKQAAFRDANKTLDGFDFRFNGKIDRALVFELATGRFIERAEDAVFLGPPAPARVIWPRPSASRSFTRAIVSPTARSTSCSRNSPTPDSTARGRSTWPRWRPCRCSSSTTWGCASSPLQPRRISSSSS